MMFQYNTEIAKITGNADEAAFVHHIWYWVVWNQARGQNLRDGKYWTFSSIQDFCKPNLFDYGLMYLWRKRGSSLSHIRTGRTAGKEANYVSG